MELVKTNPQVAESSLDELVTINELVQEYPKKFQKSQLAWLFRSRQRNGLQEAGAALLISRRPYFHKQKLTQWLLSQNK